MPGKLSYGARILVCSCLIICVGGGFAMWFASKMTLKEAQDDAMREAVGYARLLHGVTQALGKGSDSAFLLAQLNDIFQREKGAPVHLKIDAHVKDTSTGPTLEMENGAPYASAGFAFLNGSANSGLRVFVPVESVKDRWGRWGWLLGFSYIIPLLLSCLLMYLLIRWQRMSIHHVVDVTRAIGQGDYQQRIRRFRGKEFVSLFQALNKMAESIEEHIKTITAQKVQLETVLNSMNEGVMVLNSSGRVSTVNRAFSEIFPDVGDCEGKMPLEVIMSPELQKACDTVVKSTNSLSPHMTSFQMELNKNAIFDVTVVSPGKHAQGAYDLAAVAVLHDISTIIRLERVRRDFVANVSHELRTPLTSIKGYTETLLMAIEADGESGGQHKTFLDIILKHSNHMTKIVNDLLRLARLEDGKKNFVEKEMNVNEALAIAYKECAHLDGASDFRLNSQLPSTGVYVLGDLDALTRVFRNLLENAMKYGRDPDKSPGQEQEILIWSQEQGEDIVIAVQDFGPGIPKGEANRIFERFYRVEKHRKKQKGGASGLGLAISRHIVQNMGGDIWVESPADDQKSGKGAVFYFSLPKVIATEAKDSEVNLLIAS